MSDVKGFQLLVNLSATETLKHIGHGVAKIQSGGKDKAAIIHTATGEHPREARGIRSKRIAQNRRAYETGTLADVRKTVENMLRPEVVLDILQNFTVFATDKKRRRIKIICRYQQYEGTNLIIQRVIEGRIKKGLIWHFQGSGKSLLMVFAAQKLRMHPKLGNPTVLIVVDRIDLDTQITATFNAADVPNMIKAESRSELQQLLAKDVRKIIITTIHKFGEAVYLHQAKEAGRANPPATTSPNCETARRCQKFGMSC